ncbi:MAG TPA: molybdate ABC transporter substrate-binding protein [Hyphomonadaceae bacterium]|jgi:molybdate transport system substrate-binding protein|nr:molybdate ABC transporter substrate-binding protein [Hyphomonadaceae bacterium]HPI47870.1 molybdate ABC transporter substrate-binding protein [Hyphomonadaceae bacterium]
MLKMLRVAAMGFAAAMVASCGPAEAPKAVEAAAPEAAVTVFAAVSLTDVMKQLGEQYAAEGHPAPVFNFAASSELARQIEQGAGADVFISADEAWMDYLAERSLIDPASRKTLLTNTLVLVAPSDKPIAIALEPGMDLAGALKGGKLSMANPESVPAGKYGKQALEKLGVWAAVEASVVRAENVRSALRFVEAGEAAAGIVYATDARAAGGAVSVSGTFPADSHTPITYPAAVIAGKSAGGAAGFLAFLDSDTAGATFEQSGFGVR